MNLQLTIDRFEEDKAVLKTEGNETVFWPKNKLPEDAREGSVLFFKIMANEKAETNKQAQAKDILNEILDVKE